MAISKIYIQCIYNINIGKCISSVFSIVQVTKLIYHCCECYYVEEESAKRENMLINYEGHSTSYFLKP